jgi:hypothetical protein
MVRDPRRARRHPGLPWSNPRPSCRARAAAAGAVVRGVGPRTCAPPADHRRQHQPPARWRDLAQGEDGGDEVLVGDKLARDPRPERRRSDHDHLARRPRHGASGPAAQQDPTPSAASSQVGMSEYDQSLHLHAAHPGPASSSAARGGGLHRDQAGRSGQGAGSQAGARRRRRPGRGGHRLDREEQAPTSTP